MHFRAIALFAAVTQWLTVQADVPSRPMPEYDGCVDYPNGRHIHPTDCTKYVECSNDLAYEFSCPECDEELNPGRCYKGHLVYNADQGYCNWADETPCRVEGDDGDDDDDL